MKHILCSLIFSAAGFAASFVSDGSQMTSAGPSVVIHQHPAWAAPLPGSQWISIAQTGYPLATWLPNGTVVEFYDAFELSSLPASAAVAWAADDSASLWVNGSLVVEEASTVGNAYTVCSDVAPTCTGHTVTDILPWLIVGENDIRFDVAQRGGWSFGLNYSVQMLFLDEPLSTPEPGTFVVGLVVGLLLFVRVLLWLWAGRGRCS